MINRIYAIESWAEQAQRDKTFTKEKVNEWVLDSLSLLCENMESNAKYNIKKLLPVFVEDIVIVSIFYNFYSGANILNHMLVSFGELIENNKPTNSPLAFARYLCDKYISDKSNPNPTFVQDMYLLILYIASYYELDIAELLNTYTNYRTKKEEGIVNDKG